MNCIPWNFVDTFSRQDEHFAEWHRGGGGEAESVRVLPQPPGPRPRRGTLPHHHRGRSHHLDHQGGGGGCQDEGRSRTIERLTIVEQLVSTENKYYLNKINKYLLYLFWWLFQICKLFTQILCNRTVGSVFGIWCLSCSLTIVQVPLNTFTSLFYLCKTTYNRWVNRF